MKGTPSSNRKHIVLFGEANAGKSSLFNALLGQPRAIVSDRPGTTTDPVTKAMELLPYGPVTLVDTAGLYDDSPLGAARAQKTRLWLDTADLALYVIDPGSFDTIRFTAMTDEFDKRKLPYLIVLMKKDLYPLEVETGADVFLRTSALPPTHCFRISVQDEASVEALRTAMASVLQTETPQETPLIGGLLPAGSVVVLVVPIDSEAPAGRLILPQVQLIRDSLDHGIRCHVTTEKGLLDALRELARVDLVVTDSQVFALVNQITPPEIPLTSFSILMVRQKGDFLMLYEGAQAIRTLVPGDRVLIAEACTHNASHEDIGRVKLPRMLEKITGGSLAFDFCPGFSFPEKLAREPDGYKLIVHCGGCMLTPRAFSARQAYALQAGIPFTNYGMALALGSNMLERSVAMLLNPPK